jgi:predicted ATP-grasp superfamily ATP-dependent carboligase
MHPKLMLFYAPGALGPFELLRNLRSVANIVVAVPEQFRLDPGVIMLSQFFEPIFFDPNGELPDASGCDGVFCYSDLLARTTAEVAQRYGFLGQSPETAHALTDKGVQRRTLAEHGVDTIRSATLRQPQDWQQAVDFVGLPAVLKPCAGGGSRNTYLINETGTGARIVEHLLTPGTNGPSETTMILEELLTGVDQGQHGDYCSVETITVGGVMTHLPVLSKFKMGHPFRETGQFWPSHLNEAVQEQAREVTTATLRALGSLEGLTSTELKLTPDGPRVIEVNSRLNGFVSDMSTHSGGPNLFVAAAQAAVGKQPEVVFPEDMSLVFQISHFGPSDAIELLGIKGLDTVLALDGILTHRLIRGPGAQLKPGPQTQQLDIINATAKDHDEMYKLLEQIAELLTFGFRLHAKDGPETWLRGTELPSAAAFGGAS